MGQRYDRIEWAAEKYGSPEDMGVSHERAWESIEHRMEMAELRNDMEKYEQLEALHRRIGIL